MYFILAVSDILNVITMATLLIFNKDNCEVLIFYGINYLYNYRIKYAETAMSNHYLLQKKKKINNRVL